MGIFQEIIELDQARAVGEPAKKRREGKISKMAREMGCTEEVVKINSQFRAVSM